ncbi:histone-lysine N-methyltransferase SETMAR, partial [Trichonephila clavipes]
SQLASIDKNNALQEIKLRLSFLQGKSTTMSVIAHQTEKEWISVNKKSRQRMSQTQAEGTAEQHAARLEDAHLKGKNAVQARKKLIDVYGEGVLTVRQFQNWFAKFQSGIFEVEDAPRSGRSVEADIDATKALVDAN